MNEYSEAIPMGGRGKRKQSRLRPWVILALPPVAVLFQVYAPLYVGALRYVELPLLVTVYLALIRRSAVTGVLVGAAIGLLQDALSNQPLGILGMVKTLVGYAAASLGVRLDTDHAAVRFGLGAIFFVCHQLLYWAVQRALLGASAGIELPQMFLAALVNGALAVPLFYLLDKLREAE